MNGVYSGTRHPIFRRLLLIINCSDERIATKCNKNAWCRVHSRFRGKNGRLKTWVKRHAVAANFVSTAKYSSNLNARERKLCFAAVEDNYDRLTSKHFCGTTLL